LCLTTEAVPCIGNISSLSIGDTCTGTWSDLRDILRPTQKSVGFAWVFRQQQLKMKTKEQAQQSLNKKLIPVSLGPGGTAYILDAHHSLSALDLSGFKSTVIALTVSCDSLINVPASQQLNELASRKFAYLYGRVPGCPNTLPTAIPTASIPTNIAFRKSAVTMEDDRWRSIAAFTRYVQNGPISCTSTNKLCGRAYNRVCNPEGEGIPFFEFRWGYFFNGIYNNPWLWDNTTAYKAFSEGYETLISPTPQFPATQDDIDKWQAVAEYLVYPAREAYASNYKVPLGDLAGNLPGYVAGLVPIPDGDSDCTRPQCSSGDDTTLDPTRELQQCIQPTTKLNVAGINTNTNKEIE